MSVPSDHNSPNECPPIQPLATELLDALAIEMFEHDTVRAQAGLPPREGRRVFTRKERENGNRLGPVAMLDHDGELLVKLTN